MAVKTITVTTTAYQALKDQKASHESFSDTILRMTHRKSLKEFFGVLSKETGDRLEKIILEQRKRRNEAHQKRIKKIIEQLNE